MESSVTFNFLLERVCMMIVAWCLLITKKEQLIQHSCILVLG
ncbi:hypothetical protein LXL04_029897 [Taraxacum kok-saghyz]